ncbi:MAG TPA: BON domain-containing protein [Rhodospirillaceae bacterium]|nr:BON domain-containing protein [Rhodospirillaceae bacterium]
MNEYAEEAVLTASRYAAVVRRPFASLALILSLAACDPVTGTVVGGAAAVGVGAAEERGFEAAVDDAKIRTAINALYFDHDFDMYRGLTMTVTEGRVLLTGTVKRPEAHIDAVRLAWQAAGVRQVIDEIQVTDKSDVTDYATDVWIANNLRTRMMFDQNIRNINYTVDVVNGVVYLMGVAQSQEELDRVLAHARDIGNVKRVINHVLLKTDPHRHNL